MRTRGRGAGFHHPFLRAGILIPERLEVPGDKETEGRGKPNPSRTYCPLSLVTSTKTLILILGAGVGETPQEREVTDVLRPRLLQTLTQEGFGYTRGATGLLPARGNQGEQGQSKPEQPLRSSHPGVGAAPSPRSSSAQGALNCIVQGGFIKMPFSSCLSSFPSFPSQ